MSVHKQIAHSAITDDIVCGLPKNLVDNILERLPIKDAVRTSILSTKLRYLWSARTTLVFDIQFFEMNFKNKLNPAYAYIILIYNLLLLRTEPLIRFSLHIPNLSFDWNAHIDKCLLYLTRNGINEVDLFNLSGSPFQLPSCVFSCPTLKVLVVRSCKFKSTKSVYELANLNKLIMRDIAFGTDTIGDFVLSLPCLHTLLLCDCSGIKHFKIVAPQLESLYIIGDTHDVKSFPIDEFPNLCELTLGIGKKTYNEGRNNSFNFDNFLKIFRFGTRLELNGPSLKLSAVTTSDRRLSFTFLYLKHLGLHWLKFDDQDQIAYALRLLRSSPNLETLDVTALPSMLESKSVSWHLEPSNSMDEMLKLQKVKFISASCSKPELLFVRRILASSPNLNTLHFECINDKCEDLKISNELLRFRRASSQAEVIYSCETFASIKSVNRIGLLFPRG